LQRKPTSRYSDVWTSFFRGRAQAAVEAKKPARNQRAIGRTWVAGDWNDGTHETVDPGGIARLGIEAGYPRKLIFALRGQFGEQLGILEFGVFAAVVRK